jgi:hypothetical protein
MIFLTSRTPERLHPRKKVKTNTKQKILQTRRRTKIKMRRKKIRYQPVL